MVDRNAGRIRWQLFSSELIGTAVLVLVGLSLVIVMFGAGSPLVPLLPNEGLSFAIAGGATDMTMTNQNGVTVVILKTTAKSHAPN